MRVNPNFSSDILQDLFVSQNQAQIAMQQLASGKTINMPSDNPAGAAEMVQNQAQQDQTDQFLQNTTAIEGQLQTADSALSSVVEALNSAISLGTEGANGTNSTQNMQSIAQQVQGIQSQILQLANTSYQGNFVFAGTATSTIPFTLNPNSADGVTYNGNTNVNSVEIAPGNNVQTNVPGSQLFQGAGGDVFGALQQLITALQNGDSAGAGAATTQLGTALSYLSQQRVFYGNGVDQLNSNQTFLQQEQVNLQTEANTVDGANLAQATTNLSQSQVTQNAALAALAKIIPENLMDFLH